MTNCQGKSGYSGFTLLETVIVVLIVGILASAGMISFTRTLNRSFLDKAACRMLTDLRRVRQKAITDRKSYTVQIDNILKRYWVEGVESADGDRDMDVSLNDDPYKITQISLSSESLKILTFNERGEIDPQGFIRLRRGSLTVKIIIGAGGQIELE